jgi:hypothetical protein
LLRPHPEQQANLGNQAAKAVMTTTPPNRMIMMTTPALDPVSFQNFFHRSLQG